MNDIADIFDDAHYLERQTMLRMPEPRIGEVVVPAVFPTLSRTPGSIRSLGADLGSHNDVVLGGEPELSEGEIQRLRKSGMIA